MSLSSREKIYVRARLDGYPTQAEIQYHKMLGERYEINGVIQVIGGTRIFAKRGWSIIVAEEGNVEYVFDGMKWNKKPDGRAPKSILEVDYAEVEKKITEAEAEQTVKPLSPLEQAQRRVFDKKDKRRRWFTQRSD